MLTVLFIVLVTAAGVTAGYGLVIFGRALWRGRGVRVHFGKSKARLLSAKNSERGKR